MFYPNTHKCERSAGSIIFSIGKNKKKSTQNKDMNAAKSCSNALNELVHWYIGRGTIVLTSKFFWINSLRKNMSYGLSNLLFSIPFIRQASYLHPFQDK